MHWSSLPCHLSPCVFLLQHLQNEAALHKRCCGRQVVTRGQQVTEGTFNPECSHFFLLYFCGRGLSIRGNRFQQVLTTTNSPTTSKWSGGDSRPSCRWGDRLFSAAARCHKEVETHNFPILIDYFFRQCCSSRCQVAFYATQYNTLIFSSLKRRRGEALCRGNVSPAAHISH